jgi:hypothetical protein
MAGTAACLIISYNRNAKNQLKGIVLRLVFF